MSLKPGDTLGRYGDIYQEFKVVKEIPNTIQAEIAAWGDSAGGGLQYELPKPILQLIREGYIVPK